MAAILVVFAHLEVLLRTLGIPPFGWTGVDLFFVISGYVMVYTTRRRPTTPFDFARNRIARIVPIYWLVTLAVFAIAVVAPGLMQVATADPGYLFKSLFFIPFQKSNGLVQPLLYVGWTLNYEMFFYALFMLGLAFHRYALGLAVTSIIIAGLVLAGAAFPLHGVFARFYTNPIMLEFVLGMGVALIPQVPASAGGRLAKWCVAAAVAAGFAAVALAALAPARIPSLFTAGLPAAAVLLGAVTLEGWGWSLASPLWLALGDSSYILYLSHPFVTQIVQKIAPRFAPHGLATIALVALALALICVMALALHRLVEQPLSRAARRLLMSPLPAIRPSRPRRISHRTRSSRAEPGR